MGPGPPAGGKVVFIVNPTSGAGDRRTLVDELRRRLEADGRETETAVTSGPEDVSRSVERHARGENVIAVAGGDGTIRDALVGLAGRANPLLLVPTGTENLLARQLRIASTADSVRHTLAAGRVAPFDLAMHNGRPVATVIGAGFDAEVVARVAGARRGHITHFHYFGPICATLWDYGFPSLRVSADGRTVCDEPALVFVGNIPRYAAGMRILNRARWDDGLLDVCVLRCAHQAPLLAHVVRIFLNRHVGHRGASYHQARRITIESERPVRLQCDGDPAGTTPAEIAVAPSAIRICVPPDPG